MINSTFFENIKITRKLQMLFAAVFIGFMVIGLTYWVVVTNQRDSEQRSKVFIEYGQLVSDAQKNYFKVRRYEKDFLLSLSASTGQTYNEAPLQEHAKHMALLEQGMESLRALSLNVDQATPEEMLNREDTDPADYISRLVGQASSVVNDYKTSFEDIVKFNKLIGFTENDGLRSKANKVADFIGGGVSDLGQEGLLGSLNKMRSYESHILQSIDLTEAHEDLKTEKKAFVEALSKTPISAKNKVILSNFIDDYVENVNSIVANKRLANEYTELYDFMLGPIFDEMGQSSQVRIQENQTIQQARTNRITGLVAIALIAIAAGLSFLLFYFSRSITKPIGVLQDTIHKVNEGNMDARTGLARGDELGELATTFDKLLDEKVSQLANSEKEKESLNNSIIDLLKAVAQLSKKDLTIKVPVFEDVTGAVGDSLNLLTKETANALLQVRDTSARVASVSNMVRKQSNLVMAVAEQERQQVDETVKQLHQSSNSMNEISNEAQEANNRADNALKNTQSALGTVNKTINGINSIRDTIRETEKRIKRLGERSQEITGIVNLINSIAERTHILALNASMHAASAGEAGRGFAVVADEVQRLAENAREATTEIGTLVNNIRAETSDTVTAMNNAISQVAEGTQLAEQAGQAMRQTQQSTEDLVRAVEKIAKNSKAQAEASLQLVKQSNNIVVSTHTTDKHLQQQKDSTNNLVQFSRRLVETVSIFKLPMLEQPKKVVSNQNVEVPELGKILDDSKPAKRVIKNHAVNG